jgi:hypothetical protein
VLGFTETWQGSADGKELSWVNMKVPNGRDYIEFMLYRDRPSKFGTKNHVSLLVPDVQKAIKELESRPYYKTYRRPIEMQVGKNGKRQVNLYDPDGTRVELMESRTVTGKPAPSSTAPPPIAISCGSAEFSIRRATPRWSISKVSSYPDTRRSEHLSQPIAFVVNDFDGSDVATWNKGRHTFTIGGDILHLSFSPHQHCEERRVHLQRQIHFASHFQKNKGFMLGWVLLGTG